MPETTLKIPTRLRRGYTLMLRTCTRNDDGRLTAHGGFTWPALGPVECPDWKPIAECGNGLHGFLRGCGDHNFADWTDKAAWLVVEVKTSDIINLEGKIKVPRGRVLFSGDRLHALELMARLGHLDDGHMGGTSTSGYRGTSTSGDGGTSTSGNHSTSTSGYHGTSTSGDGGTSTSGDRGTSTSGDRGTSTSGDRGTSTSGDGGTLIIKWWDSSAGRYRVSSACVGDDGITAGTKYQLDATGKFVAVT